MKEPYKRGVANRFDPESCCACVETLCTENRQTRTVSISPNARKVDFKSTGRKDLGGCVRSQLVVA
jgi:hypothetical protein